MKKLRCLFFGLIFLLCAPVFAQESGSTTVYRVYNNSSLEHLYTTDRNEVISLTEGNWNEEGIGWRSSNSGDPVYRLYNPGTADHLYTLDTNEVQVLTTQQGWVQDFGGNPLFYSGGSIPVYRLFNPVNGQHHLTTDANEYATLSVSGWSGEGVKLSCDSGFIPYLDPVAVRDRIMYLQNSFPEGRPWSNDDQYISPTLVLDGYRQGGLGCHGFALICSDAAFGKLPGIKHHDINNIRVGDIVRINNDNHTIVVLDVNDQEIVATEGNYNSTIHWGRRFDRSQLDITYIVTRYP